MTSGASNLPSNRWHQLNSEEVVRLLDTDLKLGLSGAEADWHFAKGSLWWLRHVDGETKLFAVMHPKLA